MSVRLYLALLHYPVYDKNGKIVTTAVTNVDVHDLSRLSATYGLEGLFLATPVQLQRELIGEMIEHWTRGVGASYNPRRKQALDLARVVRNLGDVTEAVRLESGQAPFTIATGAGTQGDPIAHCDMRRLLEDREGSAVLVLGTGWGLERVFQDTLDFRLAPVLGNGDYNHLSVRSAAAIMLDRLVGRNRANEW